MARLQTMDQALSQLWLEDPDCAFVAGEYLEMIEDWRFPTHRVSHIPDITD